MLYTITITRNDGTQVFCFYDKEEEYRNALDILTTAGVTIETTVEPWFDDDYFTEEEEDEFTAEIFSDMVEDRWNNDQWNTKYIHHLRR